MTNTPPQIPGKYKDAVEWNIHQGWLGLQRQAREKGRPIGTEEERIIHHDSTLAWIAERGNLQVIQDMYENYLKSSLSIGSKPDGRSFS